MTVVVCTIELVIFEAQSLKDKRQVIKSLVGRIRARLNASAAETGLHEFWQRAAIGVAMVGNDKSEIENRLNLLRRLVDETEGAEAVRFEVDYGYA